LRCSNLGCMAIALSVKGGIGSSYSVADLTATTQGTCIQEIGEISSEEVAAQLMEIRDAISTALDKEPQPARIGLTSSWTEDLNDPTIQALGYFSDEHLPLLYGRRRGIRFPLVSRGFRTTLARSHGLRHTGDLLGHHSFARDSRRGCLFGSRLRGRGLNRDDRTCTFRLCVEGAHGHSWA
jgi:hypothetical protein